MQYINTTTQEVVSYSEVCKTENVSLPKGHDYGDWQAVDSIEPPVPPEGSHIESDGIKLINGRYCYAWKIVENPPVVETVPYSISRFQAMAQLETIGFLDDVEAYMSLDTTPRLQKLAWREAQDFERDSPTVLFLAEMFTWSSEYVDQLFIDAKKIKG